MAHRPRQLQPPQPLQTIKPTQPKQPAASPENIERTNKCTLNFQYLQLKKNIVSTLECNRLTIPNGIYKSIISVHCPSKPTHKWLFVGKETFEKRHADIYLGYNPITLGPEGFALRDQLFLTEFLDKSGAPLYGIKRKELDPDIDRLFDLNYLLRNLQHEPISYV